MTSFLETIRLGTTSPDNNIRKQNEEKLIQYRQSDPNGFLNDSIVAFRDEKVEPALRQAIGTICKISFASENVVQTYEVQGEGIWWYSLEPAVREEIKNIFLQNLISRIETIKLVSADLISTIFVLELPSQSWPDLLDNLASNSNHSNIDIQRSAALTLGYICEKLASSNLTLSPRETESIISGLARGLSDTQQNEEIKLTAIKALQDALPLLQSKLQDEKLRDFLLTLVMKACSHQSEEIELKAVQCLIDMIKSCYQYLTSMHMEIIVERTLDLLKSNRTSVTIVIAEFWSVVAKHEWKLQINQKVDPKITIHYFIKQFAQKLSKEFLLILLKKDTEDIDDGFSVHGATYDCLININQMAGLANRDITIEFIDKMIGSEDESNKVAALLCFEAMILGADWDVAELITSSFPTVLKFVQVNPTLCNASLKVIKAISVRYSDYLLKDTICVEWLELLIKLLQSDAKLGTLVCDILTTEGGQHFKNTLNYFQSKVDHLCRLLIEASFANLAHADLFVINDCMTTVVALIKIMSQPKELMEIIDFLNTCLCNLSMVTGENRALVKEGLLVCTLVIDNLTKAAIYTLKKSHAHRSQIVDITIATIYKFCLDECSSKSKSFSDALMVLIAIASLLKSEIDPEKFHELCKYASQALHCLNNDILMNAGLESIGDLVRSFPAQMAPHVSSILSYMIVCLNNPSLSKQMRVSIFISIGDMAIGCPQEVKKEINQLIQLYLLAFEAVIQILTTHNEQDTLQFGHSLKNAVVESLTCLCHGLYFSEKNPDPMVSKEISHLITPLNHFLNVCLQEKLNPSEFFVEQSFQLMCDLGLALQEHSGKFDMNLLRLLKQYFIAYGSKSSQYNELIAFFETVFRF